MEINLIRAVLPMMRTSRLVFQGTGQFSFKGHSIGTENNNGIVAMDLPRDPSNAGVLLICDSAENYRTDPELCRMYMTRRDFVVHLFHLVMLFNLAYIAIYGERYEPPAANIANIPEMGISDKIPVVYEDRHCTVQANIGAYSINNSILSLWIRAGESDPEDFPIAARAYARIHPLYNLDLDIQALAQDIQGNPRAMTMQQMTTISQLVTFLLLKFGRQVITVSVTGLPVRPPLPSEAAPKVETAAQKEARKKVKDAAAADLKRWDRVDKIVLLEIENLRILHSARSLTEGSKPSGFVKRRSETEQREANIRQLHLDQGVTKVKVPPKGALLLPKRGAPVSERSPWLPSLMYPDVFVTGRGDFNTERKITVAPREHLEWVIFQDTAKFRDPKG